MEENLHHNLTKMSSPHVAEKAKKTCWAISRQRHGSTGSEAMIKESEGFQAVSFRKHSLKILFCAERPDTIQNPIMRDRNYCG